MADDGADQAAPEDTAPAGLRPCAEDRHLVAFDVAGLLMVEQASEILNGWNAGDPPTPRPGTPDVATAYRDRGYEVIYMVGLPEDVELAGAPIPQTLEGWLIEHGYPSGPGTHSWFWDVAEGTTVWTSISNELLRLAGEGVSIDAGYTENPERAYGFATAGVQPARLFTLESIPVEGQVSTEGQPPGPANNPLAGDDFTTHLTTVEALEPVCLVG